MALEMVKVVFDVFDTKYGLTRLFLGLHLPSSLPSFAAFAPMITLWESPENVLAGGERPSKFAEIDVAEMEHHDGITYDNDLEPVLFPTRASNIWMEDYRQQV